LPVVRVKLFFFKAFIARIFTTQRCYLHFQVPHFQIFATVELSSFACWTEQVAIMIAFGLPSSSVTVAFDSSPCLWNC